MPVGSVTQVSQTPPQWPSEQTWEFEHLSESGTQPQPEGEVARQTSPVLGHVPPHCPLAAMSHPAVDEL